MQLTNNKKLLPHLLIILGFAVIALFYNYPQLTGKVLTQHDIISWKGMAKEAMDYHDKTGEDVLWSNSMFGGMPTYIFYLPPSNNYIPFIQTAILGIVGKPAGFLFLAMLCFYLLMRVFKVNQWLSAVGALAYAFSTYNVIIIGVGHETKMLAIAYAPAVLAGLLLIYRSDWWKGIPLLGLSLTLMVSTAHYQILYYFFIVIAFAVIGLFYIALKEKTLKQFFVASLISLVVAGAALGANMPSILPTLEYNKETMRGGNSELTINQHDKGKTSGGLDKEYAFRWSNGIGETFCLMIPYLYGGSSGESIDNAPKTAEMIGGQAAELPMYWGPQPFLSGPVYFGAIICFLFILGMLVVRSVHKWWIIAACILSIVMSWGSHFEGFNYFLFDHLPMLNKFRTPSMVLVIAQLLFPVLGIWGLQEIVAGTQDKKELLRKLKIAFGISAGICVLLGVGGSMFFNYAGYSDTQLPEQILSAIHSDRSDMAMKSALTSAVYIMLAAGLIWAYLTSKLSNLNVVVAGIGVLVLMDLISVDKRYLNEDNFSDAADYEAVFQPRPVDQQILQDKDPYYRVLDLSKDPYNDAVQAYFHKCVGGYSPAKMERYQDLIDVHMREGYNAQVLNMLNTKYIIFNAQKNQPAVMPNKDACGNAWFVSEVKWAQTADEEILALNANKLGDTALPSGAFDPKKTAVMRSSFKEVMQGFDFGKDSAAQVKLTKYDLNELAFNSVNSKNGVAVFSDMFYPYGWSAYVDGKETPIMKADYVLRAIKVPAGQHKIEFKFYPKSYHTGNNIALICSFFIFVICIGSGYQVIRKK